MAVTYYNETLPNGSVRVRCASGDEIVAVRETAAEAEHLVDVLNRYETALDNLGEARARLGAAVDVFLDACVFETETKAEQVAGLETITAALNAAAEKVVTL